MPELGPAIDTILRRCLQVSAGEEVLVIVDRKTREIGLALWEGARGLGADAVLAEMEERATHGSDPPRSVAAAMQAADVVIAPTTKSLSHAPARKRATDGGTRAVTLPGVTADMLARVMDVDLEQLAGRSRAVADLLTHGARARVTCPLGTELELALGSRVAVSDDGELGRPGAFGNLPCGEGFIAPLGGEGRIVASSLAPTGVSDPPVTLTVKGGQVVGAEGGIGPEFLSRLQAHGEPGTNLAELGVGTNDRATLSGNILEDEKILGTVHVAFGASAAFGGSVSVPIHLDAVVMDASLEVDGRSVLDGGRFVL